MAGCGGCAAARARRGLTRETKYVWTSDDGMDVVTYDSEMQAKAKVIRRGGTYTARDVSRNAS